MIISTALWLLFLLLLLLLPGKEELHSIKLIFTFNRDLKDQEEIKESWVIMEKEDRRDIEDTQVFRAFLDHL